MIYKFLAQAFGILDWGFIFPILPFSRSVSLHSDPSKFFIFHFFQPQALVHFLTWTRFGLEVSQKLPIPKVDKSWHELTRE